MDKTIGQTFMQQTEYRHMQASDQSQGLPQPPLELPYDPEAPLIDLPAPETLDFSADLSTAILRRHSVRRYAETPLSLAELAYLLWATQGVKEVRNHITLRTVPSAGARHAFETYLLVNKVVGLTPGVYRYIASEHKLLLHIETAGIADQLALAAMDQEMVKDGAVTFIWSAVAYRMVYRYGQRGYRYLHLDAGHVCQNLYLAAEAIGCGMCAIAAFDDETLNARLGLDGQDEFAIYLAALGKKP